MSDPYVGELRIWPFSWAPKGWALCNGQVLPIQQYAALYSLIGTTYGGDGKVNFALPDLRGRAPLHFQPVPLPSRATTYPLGQAVGSETCTPTSAQIPAHTHQLSASNVAATEYLAAGNVWANAGPNNLYDNAASPNVFMSANALAPAGASMAHSNMQPYTVANYSICINGLYPQRP